MEIFNQVWTRLEARSIHVDASCASNIAVRRGDGYSVTLEQLKRLAQATLHFELAFVNLTPSYRPRNRYLPSDRIRDDVAKASTVSAVVKLMHRSCERGVGPRVVRNDDRDRYLDPDFLWNSTSVETFGDFVEFRGAPAFTKPHEVPSWAQLAISFFYSAIHTPASDLEHFTHGVGGLRTFLEKFFSPERSEAARLEPLWNIARSCSTRHSPAKISKGLREKGL